MTLKTEITSYAELQAIHRGLLLAWNLGQKTIVCESDSMVALQLLKEKYNNCHPYAILISKIYQLRSRINIGI